MARTRRSKLRADRVKGDYRLDAMDRLIRREHEQEIRTATMTAKEVRNAA